MGISAALGLLQGLTEFLPISSSGHLALFDFFIEVPEMSLTLVVLMHAATLLATIAVFRRDLIELAVRFTKGLSDPITLLQTQEGKLILSLFVSSIPTALIGFVFHDLVESWAKISWFVGICFIGTALVLFSTRRQFGDKEVLSVGPALLVGIAQGLSTLPGLSRSGLTIACAMALGMNASAAFRFSFLLSIPVVAGATLIEMINAGTVNQFSSNVWTAATVSFVTGYIALRLLGQIVSKGQLWWFACYLIPLGCTLIVLDLVVNLGR